jgi:hypothetical protein
MATLTMSLEATTRVMPLGNSITYDEYHEDDRPVSMKSGYRNYLWYKLRDVGYDADFVGSRYTGSDIVPSFDGDNEGHPGWTSYQIAEHVYHYLEDYAPNVVLLHIGTNDWSTSISGVEQILDEIDRYENDNGVTVEVILAKIINRSSYSSIIGSFNANLEAMAYRRIDAGDAIELVDMEYGADIDYDRDIADGTHPNNCGYEKMANLWFAALTGEGSPGLRYAQCPEQVEEELERLESYPLQLVPEEDIVGMEVDPESKTVTFVAKVPKNGIVF